eukprot:Awhi_evm1s2004
MLHNLLLKRLLQLIKLQLNNHLLLKNQYLLKGLEQPAKETAPVEQPAEETPQRRLSNLLKRRHQLKKQLKLMSLMLKNNT